MFTLNVLIILVVGGFIGYYSPLLGFFFSDINLAIELAIYALIFLVGFEVGGSPRRLSERLAENSVQFTLLMVSTVTGSIVGSLMAGFLFNLDLTVSAAIGAGFGWYSLTGPLLTRLISVKAGYMGFLANFLREIMTMTLYPYISRKTDPFSAISMGGATTMDTTLPIILKFGSRELALPAFLHGALLTMAAPSLIMFILSL